MNETVETSTGSDPRIGSTIAGYRIERLLGRGGMGTVYLAEDIALGRSVALKLLSERLSHDEAFRERIRIESRLAASIDHPNVIPIYEAGQASEATLFIAMRYVKGSDLKQILRSEGALEQERAIELLAQVAKGLDAAHARGLIHRDVKPSNVLVAVGDDGSEHVYLADFGLTQTFDSPEAARESITLSGSSDYVSPEQIRGTRADRASDLYALGCVAYECLTGEVPFPRHSEMEVLVAHMNEVPPRPSTVNQALPGRLDDVIARVMAKEPDRRYGSATELIDSIQEACVPQRRRGGRFAAVPAAVAAIVVIAAVVPAVLLTRGGDTQPVAIASRPDMSTIETIVGTGEAGYSGDGGLATAAQLDDPGGIAVDASGNLYVADWGNERVRRVDPTGLITTIAGTGSAGYSGDGGPATDAQFSGPNEVAVDGAGNVYVADFRNGAVRKIDGAGVITTVAGVGMGTSVSAGSHSGRATDARLAQPWIAVTDDGVLYISDDFPPPHS